MQACVINAVLERSELYYQFFIQQGPAVETEKCGNGMGSSWECFYGGVGFASDVAAEIPEVQAEVGPYCRCGCVVHLGQAKPRRLLATSSQSCPGRTFWLIQVSFLCYIK
ncbi:hypothetical protein JTB14_018743 [Gonioctena quinquepunctata]|nr:hypothetical protein JTB14_018743 [Gonioctena quinquepunctata]